MFNISFCCCRHNVSNIFVQLTEGRSARDQPKQPPAKKNRHVLFGRKVLHKIGSHFRPPLPLRTGVDMGRAFSVLLFCIAMDPWYHQVHRIPRVCCINIGYMDDNATGGHGLSWLHETQQLIHQFHSAGFQVLTHSCYLAKPLFACPPNIARNPFGSSLGSSRLGSSPCGQVGLGLQSPRFSGSLVFSLPPRLSGSLRLTAPGCTLIPLGS